MENSAKRAIFIACDRRMAPHTRILLKSLERNYPDHPPIILHTKGLNAAEIKVFDRYGDVHHHGIRLPFTEDLPLMSDHSKTMIDPETTYARLAMWTKDYEHYDKILYLDADIVVLGPLDCIFEFSHPVMIKQPWYSGILLNEGDKGVVERAIEDDIFLRREMGNAGVLMVPRFYRQQTDLMLLRDLLRRYGGNLKWADQSLLNLWFLKKRIPFQERFELNLCAHQWYDYPGDYDFRRTRIVHLTGGSRAEDARLYMMRVGLNLAQIRPLIKSYIRCINYAYLVNKALNDPLGSIWRFINKYLFKRSKISTNI